ncbi:MAG: SusF/SusE family outer membrane protein [Bacteroidales bacterium]
MKRNFIHTILASLLLAALLVAACTKENPDVRLDAKLTTSQVYDVTWDSATVVGFIIAQGSGFTEKGICYDTVTAPTVDKNITMYTGGDKKATFIVRLGGLTRLTKYYARAYAVGDAGVVYGEEMEFSTTAALPTLGEITAPTLSVTNTKGVIARTAVTIPDDGGPDKTADISARGVVYGFYPGATIDSSKTTEGTGKNAFTSVASNLIGNKTYYLRAYATNKIGTSYSNEISFTTPESYGFVTTFLVKNLNKTSVTFGGLLTTDGGTAIIERGFVYGLNKNPKITDNKALFTEAADTMTVDVTGLEIYTTYHVRAFITNAVGTNYGADVEFKTLPDITKFWVVGSYNGWDNSDAAEFIISTPVNAESEGYVNFPASGAFKLTTDHSWTDPFTYGDDGTKTGKLTNKGDDIAVADAGYYLIKASLPAMTYSITKTDWGVIGSATPGGWDNSTSLTYNETSKTWRGIVHMTSGNAFKFRANNSWDVNYGSTAANDSLNPGGSDIPVTVEGDYAITLDLSHANSYKYAANTWAVVGDATPGGWDTDTDMTWDEPNHVFKVTLALTAGNFKFRANNAWAVNYGGSLTALTAGGGDIPVAEAGNYTITFDPWGLTGTITKNKKK